MLKPCSSKLLSVYSKQARRDILKKDIRMKIAKITGREIFNGAGWPALECEITLEDGSYVSASVPSGISCSAREAVRPYQTLPEASKAVAKAIEMVESTIAPLLLGKEPNVVSSDLELIELDGTPEKTKLGTNALLATSAALLRAQAAVEGMEVYELVGYLCEYSSITLPFAFFNCISGGAHVENSAVRIQEMMVIPIGIPNFRSCFQAAITLQKYLHSLLQKKFPYVAYTAQGALTAPFKDDAQALDLLMEAIEAVQKSSNHRFLIGLDVAASQFYNRSTKTYDWFGRSLQSADLIDLYARLVNQYPIFAIEDGLSERDEQGWKDMTAALEEKVQLIGDDIFATNPELIAYGIEHNVATGISIKPSQIGTITETLQAIKMCREYEILCLLSNRAYETNDPLIVELAVGTSAGYIKAGGPNRGEHLAKYNELLRIEDNLMLSLLGS